MTLNWNASSALPVYQEGGKFWGGTLPDVATDILIPHAGRYRIYYGYRTNGIAPITIEVFKNGTTLGGDAQASGSGVSGASSHATRQLDIDLLTTDKLSLKVTSTASAIARGQITIEYLGEV